MHGFGLESFGSALRLGLGSDAAFLILSWSWFGRGEDNDGWMR